MDILQYFSSSWLFHIRLHPPRFSPFQQYHFYHSCVKRKTKLSLPGSYTYQNLLSLVMLVGYTAVSSATLFLVP